MAPIYALDIETDTDGDLGLDPTRGGIVNVALSTPDRTAVFDLDTIELPDPLDGSDVSRPVREAAVLRALDEMLQGLPPGILATWNGSAFDLPFIATRAELLGVTLTLDLVADSSIVPKYGPLPGHETAYRASWYHHRHLDVCFAYQAFAAESGVPWNLKPVCRAFHIEMIEVDRTRIDELSLKERADYVASDAFGTRRLTERLDDPEGLADRLSRQ